MCFFLWLKKKKWCEHITKDEFYLQAKYISACTDVNIIGLIKIYIPEIDTSLGEDCIPKLISVISISLMAENSLSFIIHDYVIKWKHFPRYWPFVPGIHRSPVNSPHKGQWRRALVFSFICVWINGWVNNPKAGDLRCYRAHYDVTAMIHSAVGDSYSISCQKLSKYFSKWLTCLWFNVLIYCPYVSLNHT